SGAPGSDQTAPVRPALPGHALRTPPRSLRPIDVLGVQRTLGNRATARLLAGRAQSRPSVPPTFAAVRQQDADAGAPLRAEIELPEAGVELPPPAAEHEVQHVARPGQARTKPVLQMKGIPITGATVSGREPSATGVPGRAGEARLRHPEATSTVARPRRASAVVQRVLYHSPREGSAQYTPLEIANLKLSYPAQTRQIDDKEADMIDWKVFRGTKLTFRRIATGGGMGLGAVTGGKRKAPALAAPTGKRIRRPPREMLVREAPDYMQGPQWGASDGYAGGTYMKATLGPNAETLYIPAGALAPLQGDLRLAYPHTTWIQGHLLNGKLGGPNVARNLTMITQSANTSMTAVENTVRNKVAAAKNAIEPYSTHYYAVEYEVKTSLVPAKPTAPGKYVHTKVQGRAKSKKRPINSTSAADIVDTDGTDPAAVTVDIDWQDFPNTIV
ncbi:MAG: hypothetical protein M3319_14555, partial [Actinomycetota bacterium]|nr:hypothetical protein [Actinomycetota bacterium]